MISPTLSWLSTNGRHIRLPDSMARLTAGFGNGCHALFPQRVIRQTMIRYQIELKNAAPEAETPVPVVLTPVTEAFMQELQAHPWRQQPQIRTAFHLWEHGLRSGYVWQEKGRPLCMQWLFCHQDNALLQSLPIWAGLYPPLTEDCGHVENLLTFPAGLRRPGGAAVIFARSMHAMAAQRGLKRLTTHIFANNGAAQKWAHRMGWTAHGYIFRYQIDLPHLRHHPICLHTSTRTITASDSISSYDKTTVSTNKTQE